MILKSNATVVPVFFDGHNSRLFQMVSRMHTTLRVGLLMKEFHKRVDTPVRLVIGQPIPQSEMKNRSGDARTLMNFLRKSAYDLSPEPLTDYA
jgi:putative hemolysin